MVHFRGTRADAMRYVEVDRSRTDAYYLCDAIGISYTGDSAWETDSLVIVGDQTTLSASTTAGQRATCRILLDGEREIAATTGEPGEALACEATAPAFAK
ncbi:hypothetical protein [Leucobacter komagatae]|uniref:Uncharacterized protein n=1 Tax=Leucobacter komagatae TaxID=55969 RepID=A0A0D0IPE7_9MICO|nr:hypothetical protein [Leucobacter komagatae]KIP52942.1 hypothetical protein SD72_05355 [Leucobacter komagatae]